MALREFEDRHHVRWRVWDVRPETHFGRMERAAHLARFYPQAWLVFEAEGSGQRRRLHPSPRGWEGLTDAELEWLLEQAEQELPRTSKLMRTFPYPGSDIWAVYPYYSETSAGGRVVLRFSSAGRNVDLEDWPLGWAEYSDDGLVTLLRGIPRTGAPMLSEHRRRRWNDSR
jgi:hypothetical protein